VSHSHKLLKVQKNHIFTAIQRVGLDPTEFAIEDSDTEVRLNHRFSESYFIFGNSLPYVGRSKVGDWAEVPYTIHTWDSLLSAVSSWLREVKEDLETPDLWAELHRQAELFARDSSETNENKGFTPEEQREITARLRELGERLREYSLSEPVMQILNEKLEYGADAASRLGRIDWRNACAGAFIGYVLTAALPPESARSILSAFLTFLRAIGHLYGLPQLPGG
jgi:hypothetical protein